MYQEIAARSPKLRAVINVVQKGTFLANALKPLKAADIVVVVAVAGVVRLADPLERNVTVVERLVILLVPVQMGVLAMVDTLRFLREKPATHVGELVT